MAWSILMLPGLVAPPAQAMVVIQRDFPELVARAEQVVVGTVTAITQGEDESGAPSTFVTLSDLTVLKGDVGATLSLRFYGGATGNVAVMIPDMPTFTLGERDVLFVAGNGSAVCPLVGVWQGRFHVRHDDTRNADVVEDSDRNAVTGLAGRQLQRAPLRAAAIQATPITLDDFRQMVVDELAHPQSTPAR
ncbi:MAG TPA: hypothetical protein VN812_04240 [Candidatus Acidoferrales bacterium]|nr:hypothetical protein [Candidatus Acidoferrales bacterium]